MDDPWKHQLRALGAYIRAQRQLANMSLRDLAEVAQLSNAYISQLERGLHEPSIRVVRMLAQALGVPPDDLLEAAGLLDPESIETHRSTEEAIRNDVALSDAEKEALLAVYRSFRASRPE